ncbi:hypothetical protein SEA_BURLEY_21 [Gordonia phage Burley]|uniref:Uncharacterized protein n=2 Tax=Kenoshavirus TaxID=2842796 RepID=A0A649VAM1_9CAUD|nr:hypothetical protein HWC79_gp20 [Gordonia phage Untouchable]YP_009853883.1 hypothetical protein HWC81_gp20 [Gordonia phage Crocheter]QXO14626.1 hypothetical protein SEA_RUNHAAR_21 [Gordonia phage Runhaar]QZD97803.1 hypothetical protein SEA_NADMEG_21 [Gordonia phage Nadmeg]USH44682.1 hypothetical protein SEA_BURLEY_21 [Gordonia phage Burley]UVK63986.1 hypothetical protein SEA_VARDY_21 [Gordonia phage Vardy]WAB10406.1 hypothetical protein SEA_PHEPPER_21 [Gordonia phage Phepper]
MDYMGSIETVPLSELFHEYDPVKAREYYLRTRQLKGRKPAAGKTPPKGRGPSKAELAKRKLAAKRKAERAELKKKLAELEVRVDQLNRAIKQAKVAAMRRAGNVSEDTLNRMISAEVKSPGSSKGMKDEKEPDKKKEKSSKPDDKTAAEKREAAKAAKEAYEKENPDAGEDSNSDIREKVDKTAERLEKLQKRVEAIGRIGA